MCTVATSSHYTPTVAHVETVAPRNSRPQSVSTSAAITPTNEGLGTKHLHEDGDSDVVQSPLTSSPPTQPLPGTSDTADPEAPPTAVWTALT